MTSPCLKSNKYHILNMNSAYYPLSTMRDIVFLLPSWLGARLPWALVRLFEKLLHVYIGYLLLQLA